MGLRTRFYGLKFGDSGLGTRFSGSVFKVLGLRLRFCTDLFPCSFHFWLVLVSVEEYKILPKGNCIGGSVYTRAGNPSKN